MQLGLIVLSLGCYSRVYGASSDYSFINSTIAAIPFDSLIRGNSPFALERRQQICEIPGGAFCDLIHCCAPGRRCCPNACCPVTSSCFGADRCCPNVNTNCGGLQCCPPEMSCCGTRCCTSAGVCERGECIDKTLEQRIVRFEPNGQNRELLINMCNGLRGKNTEVLTYRGPDLKERARTRREAGCVDYYCRDQRRLFPNLVPATHNSCDEYPPASTLEGGVARSASQRAINCIPGRQNSHQGWVLSEYQKQLKQTGIPFDRGDKFVISIGCDKLLGPKMSGDEKRDDGQLERRDGEGFMLPGMALHRRQGETVTYSGNEAVDPTLVSQVDPTLKYLILPFGDLSTGTYSARVQIVTGSTVGGYVIDNEGWNYTINDAGVSVGQTQDYIFVVEDEAPGFGVVLATVENSTIVTWTLEGTLDSVASSTISSPNPTGSGPPSGAQTIVITFGVTVMMTIACLLGLALQ